MKWKRLKVGDIVVWRTEEFDGITQSVGIVSHIYDDHALVKAKVINPFENAQNYKNVSIKECDMTLWLDEDTEDTFKKL